MADKDDNLKDLHSEFFKVMKNCPASNHQLTSSDRTEAKKEMRKALDDMQKTLLSVIEDMK